MNPLRLSLGTTIAVVSALAVLSGCESASATGAAQTKREATVAAPGRGPNPGGAAPDATARWRDLLAEPGSSERDAELAVTLQALIDRNPAAAAESLRTLPEAMRRGVVTQLFADHARQSPRTRQLASSYGVTDPAWFSDHGHSLAYVLNTAGEYEAVIRFAVQQNATGGESEFPVDWLQAAFRAWTALQPEAAAAHVLALPAHLREEALQAVAGQWARTAPLDALGFIEKMPLENERRTGITAALRSWGESDPAAAAAWIQRLPPTSDFDLVIARLLAHDRYVEQPDEGLALAARIVDAELRSHVVGHLLKRLAEKDPAGARQRALATPALLPDDKAALLTGLHPPE